MTPAFRFLLSSSMVPLLGGCPTASDDDDSAAGDDSAADDSAPTVSFSGDVLAIEPIVASGSRAVASRR